METTHTVAECFNNPLPRVYKTEQEYHYVQASSKTTKYMVPPKVMVEESADYWKKKGVKALKDLLATPAGDNLRQIRVAITRPYLNMELESESDVCGYALEFMIRPVMEVVRLYYPDTQYTIKNKDTFVTVEISETELTEENPGNRKSGLRMDTMWKATDSSKVFLILEMKKRGIMKKKDFKKALVRYPWTQEDIAKKREEAEGLGSKSLLKANALWHVKQISAYAKRTHCPRAVVFNWDRMLICRFTFDDTQIDDSTGIAPLGEEIHMAWISEKNGKANMRSSFAGVVMDACAEYGLRKVRF